MNTALSEHAEGALFLLAFIGGGLLAMGFVWLWIVIAPEVLWWTVRQLPLQNSYDRDIAAATVASARRAYVLRIPYGFRLIVSLGGERNEQLRLMARYAGTRDMEDKDA